MIAIWKQRPFCMALCAMFALSAHAATLAEDKAQAAVLVGKMTLPEKVAQLQNSAPAIPRLGIHAYDWWNEGLHGDARGGVATVFPQAIGMAASWDPALLQQVGTVVSTEARARFNLAPGDHARYHGLTIWSPNINIFRDPRWGRGQETYGEDPYLTSQLAVGFIKGIQGDDPQHPRAIATPKHFAVHSGPEAGRHGFNVDVSPHDLEDTYLPAFREAMIEAHAGSIMCAYNALHGTPVCADGDLLTSRLRGDWGFDGYVVSDCDAVDDMTAFHHYRKDDAHSSAAALQAGTDLDCGDAYAKLFEAVQKGYVKQATLDTALMRLFTARYRLGEMSSQTHGAFDAIGADQLDSSAHRQLALRTALESMVLLKNTHAMLPLRAGMRLAVIGPNADTVETLEANYHGTARVAVTPLAGLRQRFGNDRVTYAQGSPIAAEVPVPIPETALSNGEKVGLVGDYYDTLDFSGKPRLVRTDRTIDFDWDHLAPAESLRADRYAVRWNGKLVPPGMGDYVLAVHVDRCFDCITHDAVRLYIDGQPVIDDRGDDKHMQVRLHFSDIHAHDLRLELVHNGEDQGIRLQWLAPADAQLAEAAEVAKHADAVIAFVGLSPDVEGEELPIKVAGFNAGDRTDIALPPPQRALLERVVASGKPLVVVLMSGSALAVAWAQQHADAILAAWYPGEEGGHAIGQVLSGDYNPGGRLPVTFYRSTSDLPPFTSYDMRGRTYRYFDGAVLFPFGFGLSYTHFTHAGAALSATELRAGDSLKLHVTVRNDGDRAGDDVVQVYLDSPDVPLAPRQALVVFRRVHLGPGESRLLNLEISPRQLSMVDNHGKRAVRPGHYRLFIGDGPPEISAGVRLGFSITGSVVLAR